jgi:hypothetical protein
VPRSEKQNRAILLLSPRAFVACKMGDTYQNMNRKFERISVEM